MSITVVKCPTCASMVKWTEENLYRPFCSKQCQLIDFGDWADEKNSIPSEADISDGDVWQEN